MKALNIFILLTLLFACKAQRPSSIQKVNELVENKIYKPLTIYQGDTSKYMLENFVTNQEFYKQKPICVLLNRLEVPVKDFLHGPDTDDHLYSTNLSISAYSTLEIEKKIKLKKEPAILVIYWTKPILTAKIDTLLNQKGRIWNKDLADFFGNQIIDHVGYVKYNINK
ncbi:hypothetical protein [Pedobacter mendelii]|uniref:Uncharacterized protein n=1 Tax=Pedobacter mendelii TaxID=1908240 RepID=A0ABQ2BFT7_9SPHI|nr:hypothetical protein [Pedobacter mendelii]GGI25207.1 hypothetical protein GCM10008119_16500 [Pedobacter mendelii]